MASNVSCSPPCGPAPTETLPISAAPVPCCAVSPSGPVAPSIAVQSSVVVTDEGANMLYVYTPPIVDGFPFPTVTRTLMLDLIDVTASMVGNSYTIPKTASGARQLVMTYTAANTTLPNALSIVTSVVPAAVLPANTVLPVITGVLEFGQSLTSDVGTWTGTDPITYAYQWQRGVANIAGATASTYTLVQSDVGNTVRVRITASNVSGSVSVNSASTSAIVLAPAITSQASVIVTDNDATLTYAYTPPVVSGFPVPTVTRILRLDGVDVTANMSGNDYVITKTASGTRQLVMTYTATNGTLPNATSVVTRSVLAATLPVNTVLPSITGIAQEGQLLTVSTGTWTGTTPISYAYQWQRESVNIPGATASAYTLVQGDVGNTVRVRVTASNVAGSANVNSASTPTVTTIPSVIQLSDWSLVDNPSSAGDQLALTLTALPFDGASPLTALQWRVGAGAPQTLSGLGVGQRIVTVLANTLASVEVRAVNAIGNGPWSTARTATPTAPLFPLTLYNEAGTTVITAVPALRVSINNAAFQTLTAAGLTVSQISNGVLRVAGFVGNETSIRWAYEHEWPGEPFNLAGTVSGLYARATTGGFPANVDLPGLPLAATIFETPVVTT